MTGVAAATKSFEYKVRDRSGRIVNGKLDAASEAVLVSRLKAQGMAPISIEEAGTGFDKEIKLPGSDRVGLKDLAVMSRQFATMINSGLTLLRALSILAEQTESKGLQKALTEVREQVEAGGSLSTALAEHPKVFPPIMINMCRAGEVGGFLDKAMLQVAENFESEVKLRGKIKSAMTYPTVVFVIAIVAVIGMLLFIVPIFAKMFSDMGGTLPAPTRILVTLSNLLKVGAIPLVVLIAVLLGVHSRIKHKPGYHRVVDPLFLRIPVFGGLFQKVALARFARNLGTMIQSGVPILQSLEIVGKTSGNVVIQDATEDVMASVRRGESVAAPLAEHPVFPSMMVQMLAVGEDTGAMDAMLHKLSEFYDQEVEATTEALTSLIEPLMIAFLGAIIGSMIVALYMPIFGIFNLIK